MSSKVLRCLLAPLLASALCPAVAADEIVWGKYNVPPYMILEGESVHQGVLDGALVFLEDKLPQYHHVELDAPFPRINSEIKKGSHWCFNGALMTPERETYSYFSLPSSIFLPQRIIVRRDRLAQFKNPQSLQALLQNHQLSTTVMRDRSYSPTVDKLLAANPPKENYSEQVEAVGMLLAGRIDYMIELPLLALDQARIMGHPGELTTIPIQEASEVVFNRIMCPKNEWGRKVVEEVNKVLIANRGKPYYRRLVEKWLDAGSTAEVRKIYDSVFLRTP